VTKSNPFWPQPFLLRHVAVRAAVVWILLHGIIFAVSGAAVIQLAWRASVVLAVVAAWLGYVDAKRRSELLFLGNLGIHRATVPAIWFLVVALLEILLSQLPGSVAR
jgi:steroid 5-alpha reductase family enzyme